LLVMHVLSSHPAHGYAIARAIAAMFEGTYLPSAGVVYPTLQRLEDQGYVAGRREGETTVYHLTEAGRGYLRRNEQSLAELMRFIRNRAEGPDFPILRSASKLQMTIASNLNRLTRAEKTQVARILDEANEKVSRVLKD